MQGRHGDTDIENGLVDTVGKGEGGTAGESSGPSTPGETGAGEELLHQEPRLGPVTTWRVGRPEVRAET